MCLLRNSVRDSVAAGEFADAAHAGYVGEEAAVGAGHVVFHDVVVALLAFHGGVVTAGDVLDAENDVKELHEGALAVAAAAEMAPFSLAVTFVIEHTVW
ncbi:hypothetical protein HG530_009313 [Fusarium avenaceum]|nr:hypothetical protein HG530_009313 [Fusarium avenaceum]